MDIEHDIQWVKHRIECACERVGRSAEEVTLVAVTKTIEPAAIRAAFQSGLRHFGENRVQEAKAKLQGLGELKSQSTWHMIGHLQTNKAKTAIEFFDIIQSVDSLRLAEVLNGKAEKAISILLQVNVAEEITKSGFSLAEVPQAIKEIGHFPNLEIKGLMTIAPLASDPEEVRWVFRRLKALSDSLGLKHLSMGMTDDFEVAIEEGATIVRIGRAIFGGRRG